MTPQPERGIERFDPMASEPATMHQTRSGAFVRYSDHLRAVEEERDALRGVLEEIAGHRFFFCNKCGYASEEGPDHDGCNYLAGESRSSLAARSALHQLGQPPTCNYSQDLQVGDQPEGGEIGAVPEKSVAAGGPRDAQSASRSVDLTSSDQPEQPGEAVLRRVVVWKRIPANPFHQQPEHWAAKLSCGHFLYFRETDMSDAGEHQHVGFELACPTCAGHDRSALDESDEGASGKRNSQGDCRELSSPPEQPSKESQRIACLDWEKVCTCAATQPGDDHWAPCPLAEPTAESWRPPRLQSQASEEPGEDCARCSGSGRKELFRAEAEAYLASGAPSPPACPDCHGTGTRLPGEDPTAVAPEQSDPTSEPESGTAPGGEQ